MVAALVLIMAIPLVMLAVGLVGEMVRKVARHTRLKKNPLISRGQQ
jgi:hypothetical protein